MPDSPSNRSARIVGAASLALSALAFKWGWFDVLDRAQRQAPMVWLGKMSLFVAPGFAMLGLLLLLFGDAPFIRRAIELDGEDRVSPRVVYFIVAGMIPGAILYMLLSSKLDEMGYMPIRP